MGDFTQSTVDEFLDALADRQPTPGGGAVAAMVGALAAALGRMVTAYSVGPRSTEVVRVRMSRCADQLRTLDELQRALVTQDAEAYLAMTESGRAARNNPALQPAHQETVLRAVAVPMEIATIALRMLAALDEVKSDISKYMVSDLAVAALAACAAVEAALYMVRVNLSSVDDEAVQRRIESELAVMRDRAIRLRTSIESACAGQV